MDSVKSKALCIGAAAVTLSGGDGAADDGGRGDERVQTTVLSILLYPRAISIITILNVASAHHARQEQVLIV